MAGPDISMGCGLCIYAAIERWCILHPFGADIKCCGGPRGCCSSCFESSFDRDDFDERLKKEQARNGASAEPVDSQPVPSHGMSTATTDEPRPTNVDVEVR